MLLLLLCCFYVPDFALAAPQNTSGPETVLAIEIQGNRHVETGTILEKIGSKTGERLDRKQVSRDVRKLFQTGFFSDIRVQAKEEPGGIRLIYVVKEHPLITAVQIEGNDKLFDKDLRAAMSLKPGQVLDPDKLHSDIEAIRNEYLKKGYYQVRIDPQTKTLGDGRVNVIINIVEGQVTRIKAVRFIGNQAFDERTLRSKIASRQSNTMSWFTDRDIFNRSNLNADVQLLRQFYMDNGYLDAIVESSMVRLFDDKSAFDLTYSIREGIRYKVGKLELQGDLVPDRKTLMEAIRLKSGKVFSLAAMQKSIEALSEKVGDEGYAFANVTPLFKRDPEQQLVDITFDIEKGPEVYIERIEIVGNTDTDDDVVRREIRQDEAARYSASKVNRSKQRLKRVSFFNDVRVSLPKGSSERQHKMRVEIEEKKSGSFSFGAGYSQIQKMFVQGQVQENNFLGRGIQGNLSASLGAEIQNYNISLTDPYFLGHEMSGSIGLYRSESDQLSTLTYSSSSSGGNVGIGLPLTEFLGYNISYRYDRTRLKDIPAGSSLILLSQEGTQTTGELFQRLSYDNRDNVVAPHHGHRETLGFSYAGLGGENRFWEATFSSKSYFALGDDEEFVLNPSITAKIIEPLAGRDVPLYRRYSLGGVGTVRGFDSFGISLRDPATGEAVGGDRMLAASINLFFPIPYMSAGGFRGVAFADAGTTWGTVPLVGVTEDFSFASIRTSVGVGMEWTSPFGPIALVWGFPIKKQAGDITRGFEFAVGTTF